MINILVWVGRGEIWKLRRGEREREFFSNSIITNGG